MDLTFGTRLRLQREQRQVALSAIAAATKISLSLLEGLERDDISRWPEGIFRRAYLRAYARAVGLEPEAVVREFLELHPDPVALDPFSAATAQQEEGEATGHQPAARLRRIVHSAIAAVPSLLHRTQSCEPASARATVATRDVAVRDEPAVTQPARPAAVHAVDSERGRAEAEPHQRAETETGPRERAAPEAGPHERDGAEVGPYEVVGAVAGWHDPVATDAGPYLHEKADDEACRPGPTLSAAADLCTRFARVQDCRDIAPLLGDAAEILDAVGLVVWSWDPRATALAPSLAHGYSTAMLARMPAVRLDAGNAIAAAFRSGEPCIVSGCDGATGAMVVPLLAPDGCVGVLALELLHGGEQRDAVRAFATIVAAQLVTLLGAPPLAEAVSA